MDFVQTIKNYARQITIFASNIDNGAETWDDQPSAPEGGFTDRAGFVLINDTESFADVVITEDSESLLRIRTAKVTEENNEERFYIITLDFSVDLGAVKRVIERRADISKQVFIDMLEREDVALKYIHVSYGTGRDQNGDLVGVRLEYSVEQIASMTEDQKDELLKTLESTITSVGI